MIRMKDVAAFGRFVGQWAGRADSPSLRSPLTFANSGPKGRLLQTNNPGGRFVNQKKGCAPVESGVR